MNYNPAKASGTAIGKDNIISPSVTVTGDLRFLTEQQKENARNTMREIVAKNLPGTSASIVFEDGIPSMAPTPGNEAVLKVIDGVSRALGKGASVAGDPPSHFLSRQRDPSLNGT